MGEQTDPPDIERSDDELTLAEYAPRAFDAAAQAVANEAYRRHGRGPVGHLVGALTSAGFDYGPNEFDGGVAPAEQVAARAAYGPTAVIAGALDASARGGRIRG